MNLKKLERYLRVNLLGPGPRLIKKKKRIYRAAVSQRLRNTGLIGLGSYNNCTLMCVQKFFTILIACCSIHLLSNISRRFGQLEVSKALWK